MSKFNWDRALVLWKKNLPGRGLTKVEKHCPIGLRPALKRVDRMESCKTELAMNEGGTVPFFRSLQAGFVLASG